MSNRAPKPLEQCLALCQALRSEHRWTQDWNIVRQAAVALCTTAGTPAALAEKTRSTADELRKRAGWFGALRSEARFLVAALIVRQGDQVTSFWTEVERTRKLLRNARISLLANGSLSETLAITILRQATPDLRIESTQITRFASIYRMFREEHPFLTGSDDYPACALLCASVLSQSELKNSIESIYAELRRRRFSRGNSLQSASHIMTLAVPEAGRAADRFERIWHSFKGHGLRMYSSDYKEVALLAALDASPDSVVSKVLEHREGLSAQKPRPSRAQSFVLAVSTAFAELSARLPHAQALADLKIILDVQSAIQSKQQAAAAAS